MPFKKWTKERAQFTIEKQLGKEEIVFAFLPVEDLPRNFIDEDLVPVSIDYFEEDRVLYFDIYLHMPVNQKHVLFLKNGAVFTKVSRARMVEHNIKVFYVKKEDQNLFFAYSARNSIERMPVNRSVPLEEDKKAA